MSDEYLSLSGNDPRAVRPSFEIGRAIRTTISTLFANLVPFLTLSTIAHIPVVVLNWLNRVPPAPGSGAFFFQVFLGLLAAVVAAQLTTAFVTVGVFRFLRGATVRMGECLSTGLRKFGVAFVTALAVGLLTTLGFIACIIPGFVVMMMYAVAVPVAIVENKKVIDAMERSKELTTNYRWILFATFLLAGLITTLPMQVGAVALVQHPNAQVVWVTACSIVGGTAQAVLVCVLYYHLRETREDLDVADLAAVFD